MLFSSASKWVNSLRPLNSRLFAKATIMRNAFCFSSFLHFFVSPLFVLSHIWPWRQTHTHTQWFDSQKAFPGSVVIGEKPVRLSHVPFSLYLLSFITTFHFSHLPFYFVPVKPFLSRLSFFFDTYQFDLELSMDFQVALANIQDDHQRRNFWFPGWTVGVYHFGM